MATQTDNEAENAARPPKSVFKVVRRRGDKKKSARKWLLYGASSRELARYRSERESGLTNAALLEHAKKITGPPRLYATVVAILGLTALLAWFGASRSDPIRFVLFVSLATFFKALHLQYENFVGAKAAALLAERGEERALSPLARVWNAWGKTPFLTGAGERNFDRWLTEGYTTATADLNRDLRGMARRAFPNWRRFHYRDFSDSATDTLLAALRCLAQSPINENKAILRHVARFPLPPNAPNRVLLREMAMLFLDDPKPVVPLQRHMSAAILPTPSMLPTAISPPISMEAAEQTAALNRRI